MRCEVLVSRFIVIHRDDYYETGEVITAVGNDFILVRIFPPKESNLPPFDRLHSLSSLDCPCGECSSSMFFTSRENMNNWLDIMNADDEPVSKVVEFKGKKKPSSKRKPN